MAEPSGERLGGFEVGREIGRGGMGVVYEARQVSFNRKVALILLIGGLGLNSKAVQRFRWEAEATAQLHHTNIVPVYATGSTGPRSQPVALSQYVAIIEATRKGELCRHKSSGTTSQGAISSISRRTA